MAALAVTEDHRRRQTAFFLIACCCAGAAPQWAEAGKSLLPGITLAFFLGGFALRTVLSHNKNSYDTSNLISFEGINNENLPVVDVLVAARDEENVINRLVQMIRNIQYPTEKLNLWIIDDGSKDRTGEILNELKKKFPQLHVLNRKRNAGGGKSGALNLALKATQGEWLLVLDADAQIQEDILKRLIPYAENGKWDAIQLRKAVVNSDKSKLTQLQAMEMAMDAVIQQGRLNSGGIVELRGNGQLLKRRIVEKCGGFNEKTVTDDLDLSFRFLVNKARIGILWDPPVQEEAVETISALWRQRQRWAEGGLQRFLDYWPQLISNKLNIHQKTDLTCFFLLQYALPVISIVDIIISSITHTIPSYFPLSIVAFSISGLAYWQGCRGESEGPNIPKPNPIRIMLAVLYLTHWFIIIPWVTIKMSLLPKKLIWVKTSHHG